MKIPIPFLVLGLGAVIALQGWTLKTIDELKTDVAVIKATMSVKPNNLASRNQNQTP